MAFKIYKEEKTESKPMYRVVCPKCKLVQETDNPQDFSWAGGLKLACDCPCGEHFIVPIRKVEVLVSKRRLTQVDPSQI